MTLRTVIGSHYVDGFMYIDANKDRKLDKNEFATAYKAMDEYVEDGTIDTAFKLGDTNNYGYLDWDEFWLLYQLKEGKFYQFEGTNAYRHIEYDGYKRSDGYCKKEGEEEPDFEDWIDTGIFSLDKCAEACSQNPLCSAFSFYHETALCYFYKPKNVPQTTGYFPTIGACFTKDIDTRVGRTGAAEILLSSQRA